MKVILREDVKNLGKRNAIVEVSDGHARNYLIPRKLAVPATEGNLRTTQQVKKEGEDRQTRRKDAAQKLETTIGSLTVTIRARAGENGRLFGSITNQQIAEGLQAQHGVQLDRRQLHIEEPIRVLGYHTVTVALHSDVKAKLRVEVVSEC